MTSWATQTLVLSVEGGSRTSPCQRQRLACEGDPEGNREEGASGEKSGAGEHPRGLRCELAHLPWGVSFFFPRCCLSRLDRGWQAGLAWSWVYCLAVPWPQDNARILLGEDSGPERALLMAQGSQMELGLSLLPSSLARVHGPQVTRADQPGKGPASQTTDTGPSHHQEPWKAVKTECSEVVLGR